jgi:protein gp37
MGNKTKIEWTNGGSTWNPVRGCTRASEGCRNCYAETVAARFSNPGQPYHGFADRTRSGSKWTGKLALVEHALPLPLRWTKPRMIFVNSMSDLFHESLPDEAIDRVFAVMALAPQHTFQILTKRAERMRRYMADPGCQFAIRTAMIAMGRDEALIFWPLPNVWLGDQDNGEERIPELLATPAAVRFLSCEPLLGPLRLNLLCYETGDSLPDAMRVNNERCSLNALTGITTWPNSHYQSPTIARETRIVDGTLYESRGETRALDWVIVGGESGPHARPMNPAWARSLRDQCVAAGVPFFFKQWGEWRDEAEATREHIGPGPKLFDRFGAPQGPKWHPYKAADRNGGAMIRVGKRAAGRLLDGRTWDEMPSTKGAENVA